MTVRNWVLLGLLIVLLIVGIAIKLWTRRQLRDLDGLGEITIQDGTGRVETALQKRDEGATLQPTQQENQYDQME